MELIDKLVAVSDGFDLAKLVQWKPKFGNALETFFMDEESSEEGEEEENGIGEDIRNVQRRHRLLTDLLANHKDDICWCYDQLERIDFEAHAKR